MALLPQQLVAHRGHRHPFPENSLLAILDAIAAGAVNIEFDIQLTHDQVPVLYHDLSMVRLSGLEQLITQITAAELGTAYGVEAERLGQRFSRNPIALLTDLVPIIQRNPGITFFLEIKEESLDTFGVDCCLQALVSAFLTLPKNLCLISFDEPAVTQAKTYGFTQTALVFRDWPRRNQLLAQTHADMGFINYQRIPDVETITADKPILVYEVATPELAQQLLQRGAAAVETFCIRQLLDYL